MQPCISAPPQNVALLRAGAIGDTIVMFPMVAALRRAFPAAQITAVGRSEAWEVARTAGLVDRVFSHDSIALATLTAADPDPRLREALRGTDLVLDFFTDGGQPHQGLGIARNARFNALPPREKTPSVAGYYLGCLQQIVPDTGMISDNSEMLIAPPQEGRRDILVLAPGAGSPAKRAPAAVFARESLQTEFSVTLVTGEADDGVVEEFIQSGGRHDEHLHNLPLGKLFTYLQTCRSFRANDSGIAHLATFAGLPGLIYCRPEFLAWHRRGKQRGDAATGNSGSGQFVVVRV